MEEINILIPEKLKIIQNSNYFKFGNDSVFLADFAKVRKGDFIVDFGSGSGVIPLLLAFKKEPDKIIGIEIQEKMVELSKRSVEMNELQSTIEIIKGDFSQASNFISPGAVDLILSNPPYMPADKGKITAGKAKAIARHEIYANLEDVVREGAKLLRFGGKMALVHRSFRLAEVIDVMKKYSLEPKRLRLIQPRENTTPKTFLIEAQKGGNSGIDVLPPLIVYKGNTTDYTDEVNEIYGDDNYE